MLEETFTLDLPAATGADRSPPRPGRLARFGRLAARVASGLGWLFGAASVVVGLAIVAAVPVAQLLGLGYLLEASARVARSGRVRDGWIGVRRAGRAGGIVAGCYLSLLPLRLVSSLADSAELIDPDGPVARGWRAGLLALALLTAVQVVAACARGWRLRHFAWPPGTLLWLARRLTRGGLYVESRDATWDFVAALRLPYYSRLGLLGLLGTIAWLAAPVGLIAVGRQVPLLGVIGVLALGLVVPALPFLQVRFAVEGRFRALFEVRAIRERFRRAPWAFALALLGTLAASVPLYLLKIEMVPREATWLPSLVFVLFLAPARLACGWAYARSGRREARRHWASQGLARLGMIPVAAAYVLIVFLAQYTSWGGAWSLCEQHAFLLPVPFLAY